MKKILVIFITSMLFITYLSLAVVGCKKAEETAPAPKVEAPVAQPTSLAQEPVVRTSPPPPHMPLLIERPVRGGSAGPMRSATSREYLAD
jgi:hypothetical protein